MKVSVVTFTCRSCGRVLGQSIPRVTDLGNPDPLDDEIETGRPCSPAFARGVTCPDHPPAPPDKGLRYSNAACPVLWTVRILDLPVETVGGADRG